MSRSNIRRATIQDVAKDAGVSASSISNYQNGRLNHLRPETVARIEASIRKLNYSPSGIARQLKTGHTPILGLLTPSIVNPYHAELAQALEVAAQSQGFRPILGNGFRDEELEKGFIDELISYGVKGFIVTSELRNPKIMVDYVRRGIAFVLFDLRAAELKMEGVDVVSIDNSQATSMAVDHLAALGHRSIAYVTSKPFSANRVARMSGYVDAMRRHNLAEPVVIDKEGAIAANQLDSKLAVYGQHIAGEVFKIPERPTALITMNDILAIGMFAGLNKLGLNVPKDISLVGIDDIHFASLIAPSLTTIRPDYERMADRAIECLKSRLADNSLPGRESIYAPELVVRESSAPPAVN